MPPVVRVSWQQGSALLAVGVFALSLLPCMAAHAQAPVNVTGRTSKQTVSFSDTAAFSDAAVGGNTNLSLFGVNAGDTRSFGYTVPNGATGFNVSITGPFNLAGPTFNAGTPNDVEAFTITALSANASGSATITDGLAANVAPAGADATLSTGVLGGYNFLEGTYNPLANQTAGASFMYTLVIPGDYHAVGTTSGSHELLTLNGAWTTTKNFLFNGTNTVFQAIDNSYNPSTDQINFSYEIFGAAVPLPSSVWLMGSALSALALIRRRQARSIRAA